MIQTTQFILTSLGIGMLFSVPGILLGYWLKKKNIAPNRSLLTIIFCVVLTFVKRIWIPDLALHWFALVLLTGSTLGVYRMDFYWAASPKKPLE
jgi:glucan phosphoethanolaminetransferase (alkaline phosphatase superfamily)